MKKILPITAFLSLMSIQCILAQVTLATRTQIAQDISRGDSSSISNLGVTPKLMMNPSTMEEGVKAVQKTFGTSEQSAVAVEGSPMGHQAIAVVPETRVTPMVFVRAESSEVENEIFSSPSNQTLRSRGGGAKTKNRPTGGLKHTGDTSEEESDRDDVDPDLESENQPSRSPEDVQLINSQVNKYLKKEIINNIYTECLAEVAKLTLHGHVTAENSSKEVAEWVAAKAASTYYKEKYEGNLEACKREENEAKEAVKEYRKKSDAALTVPKKAKELDQLESKAVLARATYAESDYEAKKQARELAEARVGTARATCWAIEVKNNPSRSTAEAELAECQKIESDALNVFTKAKVDLEAKAALLSAAEEHVVAKRNQLAHPKIENVTWGEDPTAIGESSKISIESPVLSDDLAEKIGRRLLGKVVEEQEAQELSEDEHCANEARWDAREKADQLVEKSAKAWAKMQRWQRAQDKVSTRRSRSASVGSNSSRNVSVASSISDMSDLGFLDTPAVGYFNEENEIMDPEVAAEQKKAKLLKEANEITSLSAEAEKAWVALAREAEIKEEAIRVLREEPPNNPQTLIERWSKTDKAAVAEREKKKKAIKMKEYCDVNAERWMTQAKVEKTEKVVRAVVKVAARAAEAYRTGTISFSDNEVVSRNAMDATHCEEAAKKEWTQWAHHDEGIIKVRNCGAEALREALSELEQADSSVCKLWKIMVERYKEGNVADTLVGSQKESPSINYFKEVDEAHNLDKEPSAIKLYAKTIKREAIRDALEAVLEGKETSVKTAKTSQLVETMAIARQGELIAQRDPDSNWQTDEPRRMAWRKIEQAKANKAAFDAFQLEVERLSGIQAVWMARLEEAAQNHAEDNATAWNKLTEEERNVYNAVTLAKNKENGEKIQKDLEKAKNAVKEAQEKADATWFNKKATLKEAEDAEAEWKKLEDAEVERQEAIRWAKLTPEERNIEKAQKNAEVAKKKAHVALLYSNGAISLEESCDLEESYRFL